jgi:serine/threonine protein kinase
MIKRKPHPNTSESLIRLKDEIGFLAKLQHMNIVKLVGCCTERGEALLAYEYMANGRLTDIISVGMPSVKLFVVHCYTDFTYFSLP